MKVSDISKTLEEFAPLSYQEDYDNCGLLCGSPHAEVKAVLLTLDCTEEVIDEAIENGCNMVVAHHPLIFSGIKKVTGENHVQRTLIKAIQNNIAIYAAHTNADNVMNGVNYKIAEKLGLKNLKILAPKENVLRKLVTYVPESHHQQILDALFNAGCGHIGNYDHCSFNITGTGTFRGNENADPYVGEPGKLSREQEIRLETVFEGMYQQKVIEALLKAHPYEEVAYDIFHLATQFNKAGSGLTGELEVEMQEEDFLALVQKALQADCLKYTKKTGKMVQKVALCGGSGRFLLKNAIKSGAQAYITADFKYHEYFEVEGKLLLIDPGHYETEQFTAEIFYEIIRKKFPTFAIRLSKIKTNPVNYFLSNER